VSKPAKEDDRMTPDHLLNACMSIMKPWTHLSHIIFPSPSHQLFGNRHVIKSGPSDEFTVATAICDSRALEPRQIQCFTAHKVVGAWKVVTKAKAKCKARATMLEAGLSKPAKCTCVYKLELLTDLESV
jgi:hypothetical protein